MINPNLALRVARVLQRRPQYELAIAAKVSQPALSLIERGYRQPSAAQAERLATALGSTVENLLPAVKEKKTEKK